MAATAHVPADDLRAAFSAAMSRLYRDEVPLYGTLLEIVAEVNAAASDAGATPDLARLGAERHGAIRLGTAAELALIRRLFAVMGMQPVGYYDLAAAGVPVHSTAFRPITDAGLARSPFRVFTSLLRLDLIADPDLRETAVALLDRRRIVSPEALALLEQAEAEGGLDADAAGRFVATVLETFRWHDEASVDAATYRRLHDSHRLIADVVSFRGPHINHLTPRTLDIDAAQDAMRARGLAAKAVIEGPPRRAVPILLRQTSFAALTETIRFPGADGGEAGRHTARFGEIEQRGAALTPTGRALYDRLLAAARADADAPAEARRLAETFAAFPDDLDALREQGLAFFRYRIVDVAAARALSDGGTRRALAPLLAAGAVRAEPITYEDFLPVSAAGIFQSNLGAGGGTTAYSAGDARAAFEDSLGAPVLDPMTLYAAAEAESLAALWQAISAAAGG